MRAGVIHLRDVGMMQRTEDLRLILKSLHRLTRAQSLSHQLQSDSAMWLLLLSFEDCAHTADAEHTRDAIPADRSTDVATARFFFVFCAENNV
jgi:hypothetical protein